MRALSRLASAAAMLVVCALAASPAAEAHIVVGTKGVRALVAESDLVLRARVVEVRGIAARSQTEPGQDRPDLEAEVLEVLKGALAEPRIRFVQHGHGVATFEPGREYLLFLVDVARSRELDALAASGAARWVSLQEHDDAHPLDGSKGAASDAAQRERSRAALLSAARAYAAAAGEPDAELRSGALRGATLALLGSGDAHLAASALLDLAVSPLELPLVASADRPALERVLDDPYTSPGVRVALLVEIERRGIVAGLPRWIALLQADAPSADLVAAIRAAGQDTRPELRARLLALLASERTEVAAAAANALGRRGDASVVPALAAALAHPSSQVRNAAIRGLGRTQTEPALRALEAAGANHADPATRRLAAAEARKRQ